MIPRFRPNSRVFFPFIVASIFYSLWSHRTLWWLWRLHKLVYCADWITQRICVTHGMATFCQAGWRMMYNISSTDTLFGEPGSPKRGTSRSACLRDMPIPLIPHPLPTTAIFFTFFNSPRLVMEVEKKASQLLQQNTQINTLEEIQR